MSDELSSICTQEDGTVEIEFSEYGGAFPYWVVVDKEGAEMLRKHLNDVHKMGVKKRAATNNRRRKSNPARGRKKG